MPAPIPGEAAAAAGIAVAVETDSVNDGFTEHNITRDLIAGILTDVGAEVDASTITTGLLPSARLAVPLPGEHIPELNANRTTAGVFAGARIPNYLVADTVTTNALARNASGSAPWYNVWMNSDRQLMRNTSSRRYKKNIKDWPRALDAIRELRPVIFDRKGTKTPNGEVGFIAEEVLEAIPEAVVYYDDQVDGLDERAIIAALVGAVKELSDRVIDLEATNGATS